MLESISPSVGKYCSLGAKFLRESVARCELVPPNNP